MDTSKDIKFFMVDDNYIFRTAASILIKRNGFTDGLEEYENGLDALNELKKLVNEGQKLPKVILLDLNMPVMTGWEFLEAVESEDPRIIKECNIYILTSSIDHLDYIASAQYSFLKGYITKPLSKSDLQKIMNEISISTTI